MWEQPAENRKTCVNACGLFERETVMIDYYVKAKIDALMEKYPDREWLCYLIGDKETNTVRDLIIPPQKVTAASVTDIDTPAGVTIIGVIHSHHKLGLQNFSGTDHNYINDNHDLSILVWNTGIMAQKKTHLPCGSIIVEKANIVFFHPDLNVEEWDGIADENIKVMAYVYTAPANVPGVYRGPGGYAGTGCQTPSTARTGVPTAQPHQVNSEKKNRKKNKKGNGQPANRNSNGNSSGKNGSKGWWRGETSEETGNVRDIADFMEDSELFDRDLPPHDVEEHFNRLDTAAIPIDMLVGKELCEACENWRGYYGQTGCELVKHITDEEGDPAQCPPVFKCEAFSPKGNNGTGENNQPWGYLWV